MPTINAANWSLVEKMIEDGLNIIPVRDVDDDYGKAKTPYKGWAKYQKEFNTKNEIYSQIDYYKTSAVAVVCGTISGNLENIDIDVKHKPGIDALIFSDLSKMYPEIFYKLKIDKTPSGGYHIIYRISDPQDDQMRSYNLASREATNEELKENPKRKKFCFIELKSNGSLSQMPPSPGYTIHQDKPIPFITWLDRCSIEITIIESSYKPTKRDNDYYDLNPFEDFNKSEAAETVLTDDGWNRHRHHNAIFNYYSNAGSKSNEVHASFNKKTGIYTIFTSNSQIESDKKYTAATVLSILKHSNDKKQTYAYLVQKGYGKVKKSREEFIVKKAAINKKSLPPNFSPDSILMHAAISQKLQIDHPYGTFWVDDAEKGVIIERERLYIVSAGLGFKLYKNSIIQVVDSIIYERTQMDYFDAIKDYIKESDEDLLFKIYNSYESFIERHGKFTISRLRELNAKDIMADTKTDCYKFYKNGMLHIDSNKWELMPMPTDKYVFNKKIQKMCFINNDSGLYIDFIMKAIGDSNY
jgi:hypothetical protein